MLPEPNIGRVFTPREWSMWLLEEVGAYDAWVNGATICDPNFGGGSFIVALLKLAKKKSRGDYAGQDFQIIWLRNKSHRQTQIIDSD
jgi:hypothetical protein